MTDERFQRIIYAVAAALVFVAIPALTLSRTWQHAGLTTILLGALLLLPFAWFLAVVPILNLFSRDK